MQWNTSNTDTLRTNKHILYKICNVVSHPAIQTTTMTLLRTRGFLNCTGWGV